MNIYSSFVRVLSVLLVIGVSFLTSPAHTFKEQDSKPAPKLFRKEAKNLEAEAITRMQPDYPLVAKMMGVDGIVEVEVTVDEWGNVIYAKASGHALLNQAAIAAARNWK